MLCSEKWARNKTKAEQLCPSSSPILFCFAIKQERRDTKEIYMSKREPVNKTNKPQPFLFEPSRNLDIQPFAFGSSNNTHTGLEGSFEHFNLTTPQLIQNKTPCNEMDQQQQMKFPAVVDIDNRTVTMPPAIIIKGKRQTHTRNYKLYVGKTIFFCGGRFLSSRAFWAFGVSLFLLIAPSVLFLIFTYAFLLQKEPHILYLTYPDRCPWLWYHVSPAVPILFAYLFCLTIASMFKTSWTDPGVSAFVAMVIFRCHKLTFKS